MTRNKNNKKFPDFKYEIPLWEKGFTVIGVDEVGRGCLAGPVYVAAACLLKREDSTDYTSRIKKMQKWGIQDSKKTSPKKRQSLEGLMRVEGVDFAISASSVNDINNIGIVKATKKAAHMAVSKLIQQLFTKRPYILSDAYRIEHSLNKGPTPENAIVRGDEKSASIAAASIFAKVARDEHMTRLSSMHPHYFWQNNKGYGTQSHRNAILNSGPCNHHRDSFIKKLVASR